MDNQELKNLWQNIVFSSVQQGRPTEEAIRLANEVVDGYRKKFAEDEAKKESN